MCALIAFISFKVAKELNMAFAWLVPFFLYFQPWFSDGAFQLYTMTPFSLFMILGIYLILKNKPCFSALCIGLLPLIRHEGILFAGLWVLFMFYRKDWKCALLTLFPLLIFQIVYYAVLNEWPFLLYFTAKPNNVYKPGPLYHFLIRLFHPRAVGIPMMFLVTGVIPGFLKDKRKTVFFLFYGLLFVLHTFFFTFGLFATNGNKQFLLPMAPAFAMAALEGLAWIQNYLTKHFSVFFSKYVDISKINKIILSSACAIIALFALYVVRPHSQDPLVAPIKEAISYVKSNYHTSPKIAANHPYIFYLYPLQIHPVTLFEKLEPFDSYPPGTILIWDSKISVLFEYDDKYFNSEGIGWKKLNSFGNDEYMAVVYQKI
jgi:hypothetical protein